MKRYLAIDVGTRRIGTAISDDEGRFALPSDVLDADKAIGLLVARTERDQLTGLVIGLPVDHKGREGLAARRTRKFAAKLEAQLQANNLSTPVVFVDERLTTIVADRLLDEAGVFGQKRKDQIDAIAAQQILQTFLDQGCDHG